MRLPFLVTAVLVAAIASGAFSDAQIRSRSPGARSLLRPRPMSTSAYQVVQAQYADRVVDSAGVVLGFCSYGSSSTPPPGHSNSGYWLNPNSDAEQAVLGTSATPSAGGITYPKTGIPGFGVRHYDDGVIWQCRDSAYYSFYGNVHNTIPHFDLMVGNQACTPEQQIYNFFQTNPWTTLWEQMNEPDNGQYNAWLTDYAGPASSPSPMPFRQAINAFYRGQTYCFADGSECFAVEPHLGCPTNVQVVPSQSLKYSHDAGFGALLASNPNFPTLPSGSTSAFVSVDGGQFHVNDKVTIGCGQNANYGSNPKYPFETITLNVEPQAVTGGVKLTWGTGTKNPYTLPSSGRPAAGVGYAMFAKGCVVPGGSFMPYSSFVSDQLQLHEVIYPEAQHIRGTSVPNLVLLNSPFAKTESFYHFLPTWSSPSPPPSAAPRMMALLDAVSLHSDCENRNVECPYPPGTGSSNVLNPSPPNCGDVHSIDGRLCAASVIGSSNPGKPFVQSNTSPWEALNDNSSQITGAGFPPMSIAGKYGPRSVFTFLNWLQQYGIEGRQYFAFGIDGASGCTGPFTATGFFYNPCVTVNGNLVATGAIKPKPTYFELRQLMSMFADPNCTYNGIQPKLNTCNYTPTSLSLSFTGDNATVFASFNQTLLENSQGRMFLVMWHGQHSWREDMEATCTSNINSCIASPSPETITIGVANHAPISATLVTIDTNYSDKTVLQAQQQNNSGVPNECPSPGSTRYFLCFVPAPFTSQLYQGYQQFNIQGLDDNVYILSWKDAVPLRSFHRRPNIRHFRRL